MKKTILTIALLAACGLTLAGGNNDHGNRRGGGQHHDNNNKGPAHGSPRDPHCDPRTPPGPPSPPDKPTKPDAPAAAPSPARAPATTRTEGSRDPAGPCSRWPTNLFCNDTP